MNKCACGCDNPVREGERFYSRECWEGPVLGTGSPVTPIRSRVTLNDDVIPLKRGRPATLTDEDRKARAAERQRKRRAKP